MTLLIVFLLSSIPLLPLQTTEGEVGLPTLFNGDLIELIVEAPEGSEVLFYTDSGGGTFITVQALQTLGISVAEDATTVDITPLFEERGLPVPLGRDGEMFIMREEPEQPDMQLAGMLGAFWFADRAWRIDYATEKLVLLPETTNASRFYQAIPLSFQEADGRRTTHFPRMTIIVEGELLEMLFDTGAQTVLTAETAERLGTQEGRQAVSFISASIFDRWHQEHPEWTVIEGGDSVLGEDLIVVPRVRVGDHASGPALFARRPDKNFSEYMSQWMDEPVVGAVGGSVLRYFTVTVDYPNASLVVEPAEKQVLFPGM